jgi:arylsulfatase
VARWPAAIEAGSRCEQVGHIIDFLPTFLDMASTDYPDKHPTFGERTVPLDGKTLLPVLRGNEREPHDYLYWHWATNRAVRKGDWKLVWDKHAKTWELYDLRADRTEAHDLASGHPELVADLTEKWNAWAKKTDVKVKN